MWNPDVEGNFRTMVLDGNREIVANGEAMIFPALGMGAFYPDNPEVLAQVSREARILLRSNGTWIEISNLRVRKDVASLPRVYFDFGAL